MLKIFVSTGLRSSVLRSYAQANSQPLSSDAHVGGSIVVVTFLTWVCSTMIGSNTAIFPSEHSQRTSLISFSRITVSVVLR